MKSISRFVSVSARFVALGCTAAALTVSARAANQPAPVRLYELPVVKFITVDGAHRLQTGHLIATGGFRLESERSTATAAPVAYRDKPLIYTEAWTAFQSLSVDAVANFELRSGAITIAGLIYFEVGAREDAIYNVGKLVNLSARSLVSANEPLIAGFVIDESHRRVLIRALGPSLVAGGVANPLPDPYLTIYHGNMAYFYNDNWGERPDANEIVEASARVGASPLPANSKESVLLVELPPGIYTAHVQPAAGEGGVALVEFYVVPE